MLETVLWVAAVVAAFFLLHRVASYAEDRGWIYYRKKKASPGTASRAFLELQSMVDPASRHMIEAEEQDPESEEAEGEK
jgi:hypothetical protein